MNPGLATAILFGTLMLFLALGIPLAFGLGGIAVIFIYFLWGPQALYSVAMNSFALGTNFILLAIPLFIFMSYMLMKSGIADALYEAMYQWLGRIRGGLAIGTVVICAIFAAMVGISGAATVSMGLIALPSMLKRNYDKSLALGCVAAGGALGILIPPSTVMIMLALFGNLSVGKLFLGGVFPGLLLSALYIIYIVIRNKLNPQLCPPVPDEEILSLKQKLLLTKSLILPVSIILIVLGAIFTGAATPTEAAGVGAIASILASAINKRLTFRNFLEACQGTLKLSGMVMWIILGAGSFTALYSAVGAQPVIEGILLSLPGGAWGTIIGMQLILFILGMILDPSGIIMITTGLFVPLVVKLGFDPLWYGVLFVVNMEMAYLTPPVGFNLFYMKAIAPDGVTMKDIYVSIIPFVILQAVGLILCMIFPQICLWLPNTFLK